MSDDISRKLRARRFYPYLFESLGRDVALTVLDIAPGERVMNVGVETGELLLKMAALTGPEGQALGVDPSAQARDLAAARMNEAGFHHVRLVEGSSTSLCAPAGPVAEGSIDAALVAYVWAHVDRTRLLEGLSQLHQVLAPGGRLSVAGVTPGEGRIGGLVASLYSRVPAVLRAPTRLPRPRLLQPFAVEAGFEVDRRLYFEQRGVPSEVLLLRKPHVAS